MLSILELGPIHGAALLVLLLIAAASTLRAVLAARRGDEVAAGALVGPLVLPLLLAVGATVFQLPAALDAAAAHASAPARQTLLAIALSRSLATQLYAGLGVAALSAGLVLGLLMVTVPGERPRVELGTSAIALGLGLVLVATAGFASSPSVVLAVRLVLYGVAAFGVITALLAAHRRGPGVQLGTLAGIAVPLFVAGIDQAAMAVVATEGLREVALAGAGDKATLLAGLGAELDVLHRFSAVHLGLATALASLGPVAAWRRERPLARSHLLALSTGVIAAGLGLGYATHWVTGLLG